MSDNTEIIAKIRGDSSSFVQSLKETEGATKWWEAALKEADVRVYRTSTEMARRTSKEIEKIRGQDVAFAESASRRMNDAIRGQKNPGYAMQNIAQFADDAQYGLKGVVNNLSPLLMSLGVGAGLAGVVTIAAAGINTLLVPALEKLLDLESDADRATRQTTASEVNAIETNRRKAAGVKAAALATAEYNAMLTQEMSILKGQTATIQENYAASQRAVDARLKNSKIKVQTGDASEVEKIKAVSALEQASMAEKVRLDKDAATLIKSNADREVAERQAEFEKATRNFGTLQTAKKELWKMFDELATSGRGETVEAKKIEAEAKRVEMAAEFWKEAKKQTENGVKDAAALQAKANQDFRRAIEDENALLMEKENNRLESESRINKVMEANAKRRQEGLNVVNEAAGNVQGEGRKLLDASGEKRRDAVRGTEEIGNDIAKKGAAMAKQDDARSQFVLELRIQALRDQGRLKQADSLNRELRMREEILKIEKLGFNAADAAALAKQIVDKDLGKQRGIRTSNPRNTTGLDSATFGGLLSRDALQTGNGPRGNLARASQTGAMDDMVKSNNAAASKRAAARNTVNFDSFGGDSRVAPGKASDNAIVAAINVMNESIKRLAKPTEPLKR